MRATLLLAATLGFAPFLVPAPAARISAGSVVPLPTAPMADTIDQLVARLDLERYKATIKGLTQFGDRRQGTDRNRAAVDWIEAHDVDDSYAMDVKYVTIDPDATCQL